MTDDGPDRTTALPDQGPPGAGDVEHPARNKLQSEGRPKTARHQLNTAQRRSKALSDRLSLRAMPGPPGDTGRAVVRLDPTSLGVLGLVPGDIVELAASRRTLARALPGATGPGSVAMDSAMLANSGATWGAEVAITPAKTAGPLTYVALRPLDGTAPVDAAHRLVAVTVCPGDTLHLAPDRRVTVVATLPAAGGLIGAQTEIDWLQGRSPARYAGIGGLTKQIAAIREMVELPLSRPDLYHRLGIRPPRGVLFVGPPGTGKTLLARAVADTADAAFHHIAGPEIVSKHYGDSESALRRVFEAAAKAAPAIIFIDELDAIAPRREGISGEKQLERRLVAQLLTLMDGLDDRGAVTVIAATNMPHMIDPALRRPGRFDRELHFGAPDAAARHDILLALLTDTPLAPDVDIAAIAARCHGHVGADIAAVVSEAAVAAVNRAVDAAGMPDGVDAEQLYLTQSDLVAAAASVRPSALRDGLVAANTLTWDDIGGLSDVKRRLTEDVVWPLSNPDLATALGVSPPSGILLAGPPGTGKTRTLRALAHESGLSMIMADAARLISQFAGEAERAVANLFDRARTASPCIIALDEIDAIAPRRGVSDGLVDRVVAQFLQEMDGLAGKSSITVVATTNRPDAIDPALLRPGRFDTVITFDLPTRSDRADIAAVHLRGRRVSPDVTEDYLASISDGFSPASIATLVQSAARRAFARIMGAGPQSMAWVGKAGTALPDHVPASAATCITRDDIAAALATMEAASQETR